MIGRPDFSHARRNVRAAVRINSETDVRVLQRPAPPGRAPSFMQKSRPFIARPDPRSVLRGRTAETFPQERQRKGWPPRESGHEKNAYTRWRGSRLPPRQRRAERSFSARQSRRIKEF